MKIILLNPPYDYKVVREGRCQHETAIWDSIYPPLSLATIASYLRDSHEVTIIDAIAEEIDIHSLIKDPRIKDVELFIASVSTPTIKEDLKILSQLKRITQAKIAIFGVHASYYAENLIKYETIDYVLLGNPETPAFRLAEGKKDRYEGIIYKENNQIIRIPASPPPSKLSLKVPSWDLVDLEKYKIPIKKKKYVLLSTARGCPFNCAFCVVPFYRGRKVRFREVSEVISELKEVTKFVDEIFFYTDLFTFNKKYVTQLCEKILAEGIKIDWICNSRVDTFDQNVAQIMRKAGCWMVSFGIESGNQQILDLMGKKITLAQSIAAVEAAKKEGIITIGHFVLGFPGETSTSLAETLKFSRKLNLDFAEFYIATPFPGSELFERIKEKLSLDWEKIRYDYNPYNYPFNLEKARKKAYLLFYLRPSKIIKFISLFGLRKLPSMIFSGIRLIFSIIRKK